MKEIKQSWAEPYKIKMVELLKMTTLSQRKVYEPKYLRFLHAKFQKL